VTALPAPQISATMPDVIGRTVLEARRVLESAGFVVFIAGNPNVPDLLGQIVASTDPAPGAIVVVGTQVTLVAFDAISTSVVPSTAVTATTVVSSATSTLPTASTISNSTSTVP
jgi:beta-lactam-binding protein with PASTA domain